MKVMGALTLSSSFDFFCNGGTILSNSLVLGAPHFFKFTSKGPDISNQQQP